MHSIDDMRSCIQGWFSEALDTKEVAKTYHVVVSEAEKLMEYEMDELQKGDPQD